MTELGRCYVRVVSESIVLVCCCLMGWIQGGGRILRTYGLVFVCACMCVAAWVFRLVRDECMEHE
jgi:uncharacterized membrane protein